MERLGPHTVISRVCNDQKWEVRLSGTMVTCHMLLLHNSHREAHHIAVTDCGDVHIRILTYKWALFTFFHFLNWQRIAGADWRLFCWVWFRAADRKSMRSQAGWLEDRTAWLASTRHNTPRESWLSYETQHITLLTQNKLNITIAIGGDSLKDPQLYVNNVYSMAVEMRWHVDNNNLSLIHCVFMFTW